MQVRLNFLSLYKKAPFYFKSISTTNPLIKKLQQQVENISYIFLLVPNINSIIINSTLFNQLSIYGYAFIRQNSNVITCNHYYVKNVEVLRDIYKAYIYVYMA